MRAMIRALAGGLLACVLAGPGAACIPRDFLAEPVRAGGRPAAVAALEIAYPGLRVARGTVRLPGGAELPFGTVRRIHPRERLADPTVAEQFVPAYTLAFDMTRRAEPWHDPGRGRNAAFFRGLWFGSQAEAAASLAVVRFAPTGAAFAVTRRHCVAVQLAAALRDIERLGPAMHPYLTGTGGGFHWRTIAGTDRLSPHGYGIAVDFNTRIGGYWRWDGAAEGRVGARTRHYPAALVQAMERRGFIWGGKWHHHDGMHFEYRPELILHARLVARGATAAAADGEERDGRGG